MRFLRYLDLSVYLRALLIYVRNPIVALVALVAEIARLFIVRLGGESGGLTGTLGSLVEGFGLCIAIIIADSAWRYGQARFEQAWSSAQRKISEILMSILGLSFILFAAQFIGGILGPLQIFLYIAVLGFLIYTLPATVLSGYPGASALQISVERARGNPLVTSILSMVTLVVFIFSSFNIFVHAFGLGYISIILAKVYDDVSYGRR